MNQVIEFGVYSASEATKILTQTASEIVEFSKDTLWSYYNDSTSLVSPGAAALDIEKDLNSSYEREKINALRKLLQMMGRGQDCRSHFPSVIKNIAFNSFQVKKLVYIYLLHYADQEPDLTLLSINTFQRDLSDANPMIRTIALRILCSIQVPMIMPIMMNAFKKAAADLSPHVRRAVAISLVKAFSMDPEQKSNLIEIIQKLLNDKSSMVIGSTLQAFQSICPERHDLCHCHFKKFCTMLDSADEWSLISILQYLDRYTKLHFPDPAELNEPKEENEPPIIRPSVNIDSFYGDSLQPEKTVAAPVLSVKDGQENEIDQDFIIFINCCKPLLSNRNPVVVLIVSRISFELPKTNNMRHLSARALIRLLSRPKHEQHVLLTAIKTLVDIDPNPWYKYISSFAIFPSEMAEIKYLKLDILSLLAVETNMNWILPELRYYSTGQNINLALYTIKTWRSIASRIPSTIQPTLESLIHLLSHPNSTIVGESIITIRLLLSSSDKSEPTSSTTSTNPKQKLLTYLVSKYTSIPVQQARASILNLVCMNMTMPSFHHAPDLLRIALSQFTDSDPHVKSQVLVLATLLRLQSILDPFPHQSIQKFVVDAFEVVVELSKLDLDFNVRDFTRFLESCLVLILETKDGEVQSKLCIWIRDMLIHYEPVSMGATSTKESHFPIESLSHFFGTIQPGFKMLPFWTNQVKCSSERQNSQDGRVVEVSSFTRNEAISPRQSVGQELKPVIKPVTEVMTLDDFYSDTYSMASSPVKAQSGPFDESEESTSSSDSSESD